MKYLIAGLGNPGIEYENTRHNVGFRILDNLAAHKSLFFSDNRLASTTTFKLKGREVTLIKPSTFMNLSGKAVQYWIQKLKIPYDRLLVIADDIALPLAKIRLRQSGSDGGHNGLKSVSEHLLTTTYPRLRFGIGNDFPKGKQSEYVLGKWINTELEILTPKLETAVQLIEDFVFIGIERAMNQYNKSE